MNYCYLDTPIGKLLLAGDQKGVHRITFPTKGNPHEAALPEPGWIESTRGPLKEAVRQLKEYFKGDRTEFDLPLAPEGTQFQKSVWRNLCDIPYGETISYGELARRVGNPKASRAVGAANGSNPLPIVVPCHRVIGSSGKMTGFGGGIPVKEALLALESKQKSLLGV
jgi:methylated-DNA-[protein]-cysteine S-methyltransferase